MKSNKDEDIFANKRSELSNITFLGDESGTVELDCLSLGGLCRKSGGLFSCLCAGMTHWTTLKAN